ncbi:NLR family CARD domain-containing protein 3 [Sarotherodon galilaeus]
MLQVEDDAGSALDAAAAVGPPPPAAAVALKLRLHDPPSWFMHVEAQFALRGILADDMKYHHVVASLDLLATRRAMTHPPKGNMPPLRGCFFGAMPSLTRSEPKSFSPSQAWVLPAAVRAGLANSPFLATRDYRSLAEEADRILLATRTFDVHALATDPPAASPPASPGASDPSLMAGIVTRRHCGKSLCFYHQHFGARVRRCLPPCSFPAQGNGPASVP